jgi:hypothetical protein
MLRRLSLLGLVALAAVWPSSSCTVGSGSITNSAQSCFDTGHGISCVSGASTSGDVDGDGTDDTLVCQDVSGEGDDETSTPSDEATDGTGDDGTMQTDDDGEDDDQDSDSDSNEECGTDPATGDGDGDGVQDAQDCDCMGGAGDDDGTVDDGTDDDGTDDDPDDDPDDGGAADAGPDTGTP